MSKMNSIWKFIRGLFVKEINQDQLFNDISNFMDTQPKVDYRKVKREGKELLECELEGEKIKFGTNPYYEDRSKLATPQPVIPTNRDYIFISSKYEKITIPDYKLSVMPANPLAVISTDDMKTEIEIEEEYDGKNND